MSDLCPCGCGDMLPPKVARVGFDSAATVMEGWVESHDISLDEFRAHDNRPEMVEMRRRVASYLRRHHWSWTRIGLFIERDHTTVIHLLKDEDVHLEVVGG